MMKRPKLDRRVKILRRVVGKDPLGNPNAAFTELAGVWASFMPVRDGERIRGGQVEALSSARFVVRWGRLTSGVDAADQIEMDGKKWRITGVKEVSRRRWIEITASLVAEGAF